MSGDWRLDESQLRSAMAARGMNYMDVVRDAEVSRSALYGWRSGRHARRREAAAVAAAVGLRLEELWTFWGCDEKES